MEKIALYPGTFDPLTNGHLDVALRAKKIFDKIIIMVADNPSKMNSFMFTSEERYEIAKSVFSNYSGFEVILSHSLTVKEAKKYHADTIIRGLRAVADFESEYQLNEVNYHLDSDIDMAYFFARGKSSYISSSTVKEIYFHGEDISSMVPKQVLDFMNNKFKK